MNKKGQENEQERRKQHSLEKKEKKKAWRDLTNGNDLRKHLRWAKWKRRLGIANSLASTEAQFIENKETRDSMQMFVWQWEALDQEQQDKFMQLH